MAEKRDGVSDGWILYKAWCERNGGTPIRGTSNSDHVCFVGPLPDDTIDPGDEGTVEIGVPDNMISDVIKERLALQLEIAKLRLKEAEFDYKVSTAQIRKYLEEK